MQKQVWWYNKQCQLFGVLLFFGSIVAWFVSIAFFAYLANSLVCGIGFVTDVAVNQPMQQFPIVWWGIFIAFLASFSFYGFTRGHDFMSLDGLAESPLFAPVGAGSFGWRMNQMNWGFEILLFAPMAMKQGIYFFFYEPIRVTNDDYHSAIALYSDLLSENSWFVVPRDNCIEQSASCIEQSASLLFRLGYIRYSENRDGSISIRIPSNESDLY
ncbi:MAG: hypothetical protein ACRCUY_13235 [Thermoguttaceae bacterium]